MATRGEVILRRTWPQRIVVLLTLAVMAAALAGAWFVETVYETFIEYERVKILGNDSFGQPLLRTETPSGEPVNFLIVGTDSALGLDPDDPVLNERTVDPSGRSLADTILLLRLDPASRSAWVVSLPRDLWVKVPGAADHKIASTLWIGGPALLVETVKANFDVEINHYVRLDFLGFRQVVDVLGGVPVWFPNPTRDAGSGLDIETPGCHVLNGEQALQYVRGRSYQEHIDGRWTTTGSDDFRRIERQQDFLVLALDRAIERGARSPGTMTSLLEAGAGSVTLDQALTLAELIQLGQAFSQFDPENLNRYSLQLYGLFRPDGSYQGEALVGGVNDRIFDVFRGAVDPIRPQDVAVSLAGADDGDLQDASTVLAGQGFVLTEVISTSSPIEAGMILHGPEDRARALRLATYLDPVPHLVLDAELEGVVLALGLDYRGVLFLYQTPDADVEAAIAAKGIPAVLPDLSGLSSSNGSADSDGSAGSESAAGSEGAAVVSTTSLPEDSAEPGSAGSEVPSDEVVMRGRAPEGESCG